MGENQFFGKISHFLSPVQGKKPVKIPFNFNLGIFSAIKNFQGTLSNTLEFFHIKKKQKQKRKK